MCIRDRAGGAGEEVFKFNFGAHGDGLEKLLDLVRHGVAVIDDLAEVAGVFKALEDALEGADEVEDAHLADGLHRGVEVLSLIHI